MNKDNAMREALNNPAVNDYLNSPQGKQETRSNNLRSFGLTQLIIAVLISVVLIMIPLAGGAGLDDGGLTIGTAIAISFALVVESVLVYLFLNVFCDTANNIRRLRFLSDERENQRINTLINE